MKLRPYQIDFVKSILQEYSNGVHGVIGEMPTGSGKTICMSRLAKWFVSRDRNVLILVHRDELVKQTSSKLAAMGVPHGIVASKMHNPDARAMVQVAMVQTIVRRLDRIKRDFGLIIVDEAHLGAAKSYLSIIERWPEAFRLGLSATPYRTDKKGLSVIGTSLIKGPSIRDLISAGSLVKFRTIGVDIASLAGLKIINGEYDRESQSKILSRPHVVGKVVENYKLYANGRSALVFAASREHSKRLYLEFRNQNIRAYHIDGETPYEIREKAIRMLEQGKIKVLCNYGCLTEGFDSTIVSAIIVARKTASPALWKQMVGRGMRTHPGKENCMIIDHGGNSLEHGNVDWDHQYSIFSSPKKRSREVLCKVCKNCATVIALNEPVCPECKFSYEAAQNERKIIEADGDLVEITESAPVINLSRRQVIAGRIEARREITRKVDAFLEEMGL